MSFLLFFTFSDLSVHISRTRISEENEVKQTLFGKIVKVEPCEGSIVIDALVRG